MILFLYRFLKISSEYLNVFLTTADIPDHTCGQNILVPVKKFILMKK